MLLMVEKGISIRGAICHTIHQYVKANNKCMKDYDKNKESSYFKYQNVNNLYEWAMSQKLPVNNFKWIEDVSKFNKDFIKSYNDESEEVRKNIFLKLKLNIVKIYIIFTMVYLFSLKE